MPTGAPIASTATVGGGAYLFSGLAAGSYFVQFLLPAGEWFTWPDVGGNDGIDSDADPATGLTAVFSLAPNQTDLTWDAGLMPVEIDVFPYSLGEVTLQMPGGATETVTLAGPTTVHVAIPPDGTAADTDSDGLDQVPAEMVQLDLWGSSSLGPVHVRLDPAQRTLGEIEEQTNNTPGTLDVAPFRLTGLADSFFDVFFEIEVGGPGAARRDSRADGGGDQPQAAGAGGAVREPVPAADRAAGRRRERHGDAAGARGAHAEPRDRDRRVPRVAWRGDVAAAGR